MAHKCFICFKTEDKEYKRIILEDLKIDMIDKSLHVPIDSTDEDYIMRKIREDYLADSTVTIYLIGQHSAENSWFQDQTFIKRELQASLYNGENNSRSGILGIVLPSMYDTIYQGSSICNTCGNSHQQVKIDDGTTVKEFSYNYYLPTPKCAWKEEDRYCVLVRWDQFKESPEKYIDQAFDKRFNEIALKIKVKP